MTGSSQPPARPGGFVDGIDLDLVAAAVRSCPGVSDLDGGPLGAATTYLPGRRIHGLQTGDRTLTVSVRSHWDVSAVEVARQIQHSVGPLAAGRAVDVIISDIEVPPGESPNTVKAWTTSGGAESNGALSSALTTPTTAATRPISPPG
jgi:hypothetical protein